MNPTRIQPPLALDRSVCKCNALLIAILIVLINAPHACSQTIWSGFGVTGNWSEGANWIGGDPPTSAPSTSLLFANPSVNSMPNQDSASPFTLGNINADTSNGDFDFTGGNINVTGGSLGTSGPGTATFANNFNFNNGAGIDMDGGELVYSGTTLTQSSQSVTNITGNGELYFDELTSLPATLNIGSGVTTFFQTGSIPVNVSNGLVTEGNTFLGFTTLNFVNGATFNGFVDSSFGTIRGTATINGTTFIANEGSLRVDDNATINGNGDVDIFGAALDMGANATVDKSVDAVFGLIFGDALSSTITGSVTMRDSTLFGAMKIDGGLGIVQGSNGLSSLANNTNVEVVGNTIVQNGILEIGANSLLSGTGSLIANDGATLDLQDGTVQKEVTISALAYLQGNGVIDGDLYIDGNLGPGNSAGTVTVRGDIHMGGTTVTCVELGGSDPGTYDVIRTPEPFLANTAFLDGELMVTLIDGFVPTSSDEFMFIDGFDISGEFSNTGGPGDFGSFGTLEIDGGRFQVEYGSNFVRLFGYSAVPEPSTVLVLFAIAGATCMRRRRMIQVVQPERL